MKKVVFFLVYTIVGSWATVAASSVPQELLFQIHLFVDPFSCEGFAMRLLVPLQTDQRAQIYAQVCQNSLKKAALTSEFHKNKKFRNYVLRFYSLIFSNHSKYQVLLKNDVILVTRALWQLAVSSLKKRYNFPQRQIALCGKKCCASGMCLVLYSTYFFDKLLQRTDEEKGFMLQQCKGFVSQEVLESVVGYTYKKMKQKKQLLFVHSLFDSVLNFVATITQDFK